MKTTLVALVAACVLLIPVLFAQGTPVLPLVKIPESVSKTLRIHYLAPTYPADAMRDCVEGEVVLRLIVSETGTVSHVTRGGAQRTDCPCRLSNRRNEEVDVRTVHFGRETHTVQNTSYGKISGSTRPVSRPQHELAANHSRSGSHEVSPGIEVGN